ncbi:hypothetical protein B0T25DRAFT_204144 [Lasiosphaeria hispida]|uniref:Uncharacterized protein n=1 Tax=Lasiosphaeria hispida TaxID=260671 RepID=A0AAJ0ME70_9PEZI|nr:hypothetical protein B0T25DRAFT_204144 [Lasiosphaeria hispida]
MATTTPESDQRQQEVLVSVDQGKNEAGKTPIHCCPSFATPTQLRRLGPTAASRVKQSQTHVPCTDIDSVALLGRVENATSSTNATDPSADQTPAVRFKSTIEEIAPDDTSAACHPAKTDTPLGDPGEVTPEQIRDLTKRLKACPLQERRMNIFSYEAFSLPPSRVCFVLQVPCSHIGSSPASLLPQLLLPYRGRIPSVSALTKSPECPENS